jgi:hypothetical protein
MRYFNLFICLFYLNKLVLAQDDTPALLPKKDVTIDSVVITGNCWRTVHKDSLPFFIVDGRLSSYEEMAALDINTIQSVDVLKTDKALTFCSGRGANGVVVIVTKPVEGHVFKIADAEDNAGVSAATVTFIDHNNDSIRLIADKAGKIQTSALKYGIEYTVNITSIGYKNFTASYKCSKGKTTEQYRLSRDVKLSQEVIVKSYGYRRIWCRGGCGGALMKYLPLKKAPEPAGNTIVSKVYPNPVVKGNALKIEFQSDAQQSLQVRIFDLNGAQLSRRSYQSTEGVNRVEVPVASHWSSGAYAVQVVDDKGKLIIQTKVVVQ